MPSLPPSCPLFWGMDYAALSLSLSPCLPQKKVFLGLSVVHPPPSTPPASHFFLSLDAVSPIKKVSCPSSSNLSLPLSTKQVITTHKERHQACPTNDALLISSRLSSNAEILWTSTDWAYRLAPNVCKRVCNVYIFQLSFQFAYQRWWLGMPPFSFKKKEVNTHTPP